MFVSFLYLQIILLRIEFAKHATEYDSSYSFTGLIYTAEALRRFAGLGAAHKLLGSLILDFTIMSFVAFLENR
jgi:hypothetical protein